MGGRQWPLARHTWPYQAPKTYTHPGTHHVDSIHTERYWQQWAGKVPTSTQILFNKFHLQVEYLLLEFADGVFGSLTPCHHVAQISNLREYKRHFPLHSQATTSDLPALGGHQLPVLPSTSGNQFPDPAGTLSPEPQHSDPQLGLEALAEPKRAGVTAA